MLVMLYSAHLTINDMNNAVYAKMEAMIRQDCHQSIRGDVEMFLQQKLVQVSTFYQIMYRKESGWP
jgi:hypothetical protein